MEKCWCSPKFPLKVSCILKIFNRKNIFCSIPYSVLMDTNYICAFFTFICKPQCDLPDSQFRDVLFEVIKANRISERFSTSDEIWHRYSIRDKSLKKTWIFFSWKYQWPLSRHNCCKPKRILSFLKANTWIKNIKV